MDILKQRDEIEAEVQFRALHIFNMMLSLDASRALELKIDYVIPEGVRGSNIDIEVSHHEESDYNWPNEKFTKYVTIHVDECEDQWEDLPRDSWAHKMPYDIFIGPELALFEYCSNVIKQEHDRNVKITNQSTYLPLFDLDPETLENIAKYIKETPIKVGATASEVYNMRMKYLKQIGINVHDVKD